MDARISEAARRRLADDFVGARQLCLDVLAGAPDNAEAMGLIGVCALETGDLDGARSWLDRAEAADPACGPVHLYRSMLHEAEGDAGAALASARQACEVAPDRFDVWGRYGDLAGRAGDFLTSAHALAAALDADPSHPAHPHVALRLAGARTETGDIKGAAEALDMAAAGGLGDTLEVVRLRVELARHAGDWSALIRYAERWQALDPTALEAKGALAMGWGRQGHYRRALRLFAPVLEAEPDRADYWAAQGRLILGARDIAGAQAAFDRALSLDADCSDATLGLARIHTFLGEVDAAARMCRRTLEIDPGSLEAYGQLCEVSGGWLTDEELERLECDIAKSGNPADRLSIGLFALGDAYHRRRRPADAFAAWERANDTKKLQHNGAVVSAYDRAEQDRRTDWLMRAFSEPVALPVQPASAQTPIFIVGMPRSGTTLIEAAIAAHEDVTAGGELSLMPVIFEEFMAWARSAGWSGGVIPETVLEPWRRRYLAQYSEFGLTGARWVTDKQPSNFMAVGLIRQLFPAAPVIHIRRKPVEVAFSIFRRNFSRMWPFAHDLEDIAHYYASQSRLGGFWPTVWPDAVTPLQYENLVREFEPQLRRVLARSGLSWSRRCLEYYVEADRAVMTFSAVQVRKPPSPEHLDSTSPYSEWLGVFNDALSAFPVDAETGVWRDPRQGHDPGEAPRPPVRSSGVLGRLFGRKQERDVS